MRWASTEPYDDIRRVAAGAHLRVVWHFGEELWVHSRIRINGGKTQIWNRGGFIAPDHGVLFAIACQDDPDAQIWFGDHVAPESERGVRVLGTLLGSNAFVRAQLQAIGESHELLLSRIPAIQDLQSAWLLLLVQQPVPRSIFGCVIPSIVPTSMTCWGCWADCLSTIRQRHANIAQTMVQALDSPPETAIHLVGAARSRATLASEGFQSPSWHQLLQGLRPQQPAFDEMEPGFFSHGWQFLAAKVVEQRFRSTIVWPRCTPIQQALRRLWLPLPLASHTCRCGRLLDVLGHHCAACARAGVLGGGQEIPTVTRVGGESPFWAHQWARESSS